MSESLYDKILAQTMNSGNVSAAKLAAQNERAKQKVQEHYGVRDTPSNVDYYGAIQSPVHGSESANQGEIDAVTMSPSELLGTYSGEDLGEILSNRSAAGNQAFVDNTIEADWETRAADAVNNAGGAALQGLAGLAHVGGMAVDAVTGIPLDRATGSLYNYLDEQIEEHKSPYQQAQERKYNAELARRNRDIESREYDSTFDKLMDEASTTVGALANNPEQILSIAEQGVGSLLSGGLGGAGIKAIASKAVLETQKSNFKKDVIRAVGKDATPEVAEKTAEAMVKNVADISKQLGNAKDTITEKALLARLAETAPYVTANALQEAGSIGIDTYNSIMDMSHDSLIRSSKEYRDRLKSGESPEEARRNVASIASKVASASAVPMLLTANALVGGFLESPFGAITGKNAIGLMGKEAISEGIEEGSGTFASNVAIQNYADEFFDVTQGLAQSAVEGAVGGIGTVGITKTPSAAKGVIKHTAVGAKNAVVGAANVASKKSENRVKAQDTKQFTETVAPQFEESKAKVDEAINKYYTEAEIEAQGANVENIAKGVAQLTNPVVNRDTYANANLSQEFLDSHDIQEETKPILQHIQDLDEMISDPNTQESDKLALLDMMMEAIDSTAGIRKLGAGGHPEVVSAIAEHVDNINETLRNMPSVGKTIEKAIRVYEQLNVPKDIQENAPDEANLAHLVNKSKYAPESLNSVESEAILAHAKNSGKYSAEELRGLDLTTKLLKAAEDNINALREYGDLTAQGLVSENITTIGKDDVGEVGKISAKAHVNKITKAMNKGDRESAKIYMEDLRDFGQHMLNKLEALSKSMKDGQIHSFLARSPEGSFFTSKEKYGVNKTKSSHKFASNVEAEANFLVDVYNSLNQEFSDLGTGNLPNMKLGQTLDTLASTKPEPKKEVKTPAKPKKEKAVKKKEETTEVVEKEVEKPNAKVKEKVSDISPESLEDFTFEEVDIFDLNEDPLAHVKSNTESEAGKNHSIMSREEFSNLRIKDGTKGVIKAPEEIDGIVYYYDPNETNDVVGFDRERGKTYVNMALVSDPNAVRSFINKYAKEGFNALGMAPKDVLKIFTDAKGNFDALGAATFLQRYLTNKLISMKNGKYPTKDGKLNKEHVLYENVEVDNIVRAMTPHTARNFDRVSKEEGLFSKANPELVNIGGNPEDSNYNGMALAYYSSIRSASNLSFVSKPINFLYGIMGNAQDKLFPIFKNKGWYKGITSEYKSFMKTYLPQMKSELNARLNDIKMDKEGSTAGDLIKKGTSVNRYSRGQVLNITELQSDGSLKYNDKLVELGMLAATQVLFDGHNSYGDLDVTQIADKLGINQSEITEELIENLTQGMIEDDIKRTIADKIRKYWGLQYDRDSPQGLVKGIPEALATELIHAMRKVKYKDGTPLITRSTIDIVSTDKDGKELLKTPYTYKLVDLGKDSAIYKYPTVIEENVMKSPEKLWYLNGETPKTDQFASRSDLELTKTNKEALKASNNVEYSHDKGFFNMIKAIGVDLINDLIFPETSGDLKKFNIVSRESAMSKRNILAEAILDLENALEASAAMGAEFFKAKFKHFIASDKRVHQSQPGTQANKPMREFLVPSNETLDLTNEDTLRVYRTALAQGFGLDVNKKTYATISKELDALLEELAPYVKEIQKWNKDPESADIAKAMKSALSVNGMDATMVSAHNLYEYALYEESTNKEAFESNIYIEIDGITSGSALASLMFGENLGNQGLVDLMERSGFSIVNLDENYNSKRENGMNDNYMELSDRLSEQGILTLDLANDEESKATKQMTQMFLDYMPRTVKESAKTEGVIEADRNFVKNLLTVLIYGSGNKGIADNYTSQVIKHIYEDINQLAQHGFDSFSREQLKEFATKFKNINELMGKEFRSSEEDSSEGLFYSDPSLVNKKLPTTPREFANFDFRNFRFDSGDISRISKVVQHKFAAPAKEIAGGVMTHQVMNNLSSIGRGLNYVSMLTKALYEQYEKDLLKTKDKSTGWNSADGLTMQEVQEINAKIDAKINVPVIGGIHKPVINKSGSANNRDANRGRGLDGSMRLQDDSFAKELLGVAGVALTNIGFGDARITQLIASKLGKAYQGTGVHDGTNIGINGAVEFGKTINELTLNTMIGDNILAEIGEFLQDVVNNLDDILKDLDPASRSVFTNEFFKAEIAEYKKRGMTYPADNTNIKDKLEMLTGKLLNSAINIEANHNMLKKTKMSSNNYNGIEGIEYSQDGIVYGTQEWNKAYNEEYKKAREKYQAEFGKNPYVAPKKKEPTPKKSNKAFKPIRTEVAGILPVLSKYNIPIKKGTLNERIVMHLSKNTKLGDLNVVVGDMDTMLTERGLDASAYDGDVQGLFIPNTLSGVPEVLISNTATNETIAHELIHAGTHRAVKGYMSKGIDGLIGSESQKEAVGKAIDDTIGIMKTFMKDVQHKMDNDMYVSVGEQDLYTQIMTYTTNGNPTSALLEFMAWGLTNRDVSQNLKSKTKDANKGFWLKAEMRIKGLISKILTYYGIPSSAFKNLHERLSFNTLLIQEANVGSINPTTGKESYAHAVNLGKSNELIANYESAYKAIISGKAHDPEFNKAITEVFEGAYSKVYNSRAEDVLQSLSSKGISLDAEQQYAFKLIANTLAADSGLSPETMLYTQKLYTHVLDNVIVEDFMKDPSSNNPADLVKAKALYEGLFGGKDVKSDNGTSYLLPSFIALASVSPEFSAGISKVDMPDKIKGNGTIDSYLKAKGENGVNSLTRSLSGVSRHTSTINEAISSAVLNYVRSQAKEESLLDRGSIITTRGKDWVNDKLVDVIDKTGDKIKEVGENWREKADTRVGKITASAVSITGSLIQDKDGELTKMGLEALANNAKTPNPIKELLTDLIGLSSTNAPVYNMIKKVKSHIQRLRQTARETIPATLSNLFKERIDRDTWQSIHKSIGKTDLSALLGSFVYSKAIRVISNESNLSKEISNLENDITNIDPVRSTRILRKAKELANYMVTGEVSSNQLMNAMQVSKLVGEPVKAPNVFSTSDLNKLDSLISLYAFQMMNGHDKKVLRDLIRTEPKAIEGIVRFAKSVQDSELTKDVQGSAGMANRRKGWTPFVKDSRKNLIIQDDASAGQLLGMGYVRVGDYKGSNMENSNGSKGYYYLDVTASAPYHQGVMQNIKTTVGGTDDLTGAGINPSAGLITDRAEVKIIHQKMINSNSKNVEGLIPIYLTPDSVVPYAFERAVSSEMLDLLEPNKNYAELLGVHRGRQLEESAAKMSNMALVDNLKDMYDKAVEDNAHHQYIDLFSKDIKDPVILDAVKLIPKHIRDYIDITYEGKFMVPRSMVNDVVGYRMAVVGDAWTGNTRWSPEVQAMFREVAQAFLGDKAYRWLMKSQFLVQDLVQDARTIIVIKSVVVPVVNILSNMAQLVARGVPIVDIAKSTPKIVNEINYYTSVSSKIQEAQIEKEINSLNPKKVKELEAKIQSLDESIKRLSIYPLIEAGEFTSVSNSTIDREATDLELGQVDSFIESAVDKLPEGVRTLGKYAIVSSDTALFQVLQKATDYGDFVAKAILYNDLVKRKSMDKTKALGIITDEYVNYDKLQGRFRHTVENLGLLWFYNWKIRTTKVGISTLRNNPFHAILAANLPLPETFGTIGLPFEDSILGRMLGTGSLKNSVGIGMGLNAPSLNPWVNLLN